MFVFPLVTAARKRALVKRWSRRLLRILSVEAQVDGDARCGRRQRAGRREPHLVARHLRAERRASGALRREVRARALAGRRRDDPRRGHAVHRARAPPRHASRQPARSRRCSQAATSSRSFPKARRRTDSTCCRSRARSCSRSSMREGHVQPVAIRYRAPDGARSLAPAYVGDTSFAQSFWRVCGERALAVELIALPALPARAGHRRELARAAEASIRTALAAPDAAHGTWNTRRSGSRIAGKRPAPQAARSRASARSARA